MSMGYVLSSGHGGESVIMAVTGQPARAGV